MAPFFKFICTECGHRDEPCQHYQETQLSQIIRLLNEIRAKLEIARVEQHAVGGSSSEPGAKPETS